MEEVAMTTTMTCGGTGAEQKATAEIQSLVDPLKDTVLKYHQGKGYNGVYSTFEAVKFKSQVFSPNKSITFKIMFDHNYNT